MADTTNFGRNGEMPKPKPRFWRWRFGLIVLYLCIAGLFAISEFGQVLAVVSMISIIGIPIAFLIMALPSVALVAFTVWLCHKVLVRFGTGSLIVASGLTLAILAGYPQIHNFFMTSKVASLVEDDRMYADEGNIVVAGSTFGLVSKGRKHKCYALCQRILLASGASSVLVANMPKSRIDAKLDLSGKSFSLVKRNRCTQGEEQNAGLLVYSSKDVAAELAMRAKLESGHCLVVEKARLEQADHVFYQNHRWGRSAFTSSYNPLAQLIFARRFGFYTKNAGNRFELRSQKTLVDYALLGPFVSIAYRAGAGLQMKPDIWRQRHHTYDRKTEKFDPVNFLSSGMGIALKLPGDSQQ